MGKCRNKRSCAGSSLAFRRTLLSPPSSGTSYDSSAQDLFGLWESLGTPSNTDDKTNINNAIVEMKDLSVWDELDILPVWTAHSETAGLVDWKRLVSMTKVGSVNHTAYEGFRGAGGRINLGYNPGDGLATYKFTQNSTSFGVYVKDRIATNTRDLSALTSATTGIDLVVCGATPSIFGINNDTAARTGNSYTGTGMCALVRTASNAHYSTERGYNNDTAFTQASQPVQNRIWNAFTRNVGDTTYTTPSLRMQRFLYAGSKLVNPFTITRIMEEHWLAPLNACAKKRLIISSNSLMDTNGATDQLLATLNMYETLDVNCRGLSGQGTPQLQTDAVTNIYPYQKNYLTQDVILVWELTNDMAINGASPTTAYNNLVTYCQALRSNFPTAVIVVMTMLPRGAIATRQNDADLTDATTTNGKVRNNNETDWNYLVDVASDLNIGQNGQNTDLTYYEADTIHLNSTGRQYMIDNYLAPLLTTLFA